MWDMYTFNARWNKIRSRASIRGFQPPNDWPAERMGEARLHYYAYYAFYYDIYTWNMLLAAVIEVLFYGYADALSIAFSARSSGTTSHDHKCCTQICWENAAGTESASNLRWHAVSNRADAIVFGWRTVGFLAKQACDSLFVKEEACELFPGHNKARLSDLQLLLLSG